jgi:hypothetical protein
MIISKKLVLLSEVLRSSMLDLKNEILSLDIVIIRPTRVFIRQKNITPMLLEKIIKETVNCRDNISERIYWVINNITQYPLCSHCKKTFMPRFYGQTHGYWGAENCSYSCTQNSEKHKIKLQETFMKNWGVLNPYQSKEIQQKIQKDRLEQTGYAHPMQNPKIKKQSQSTLFEKTGFTNPNQNPETQEKIKKTTIRKLGVEHNSQSELIKNKKRETNLTRRKVENPFQDKQLMLSVQQRRLEETGYSHSLQNPEVRLKCEQTYLEKTGFRSPAQNPEVSEKTQKHRTYSAIMPSGLEIKYQGYELVAINELLKNFNELDFTNVRKEIPQIWYNDDAGKKHRYFPDIFIPKKNLIIEVKSTYTYSRYLTKNNIKKHAVLQLGYNFEFWICSETEVIEVI